MECREVDSHSKEPTTLEEQLDELCLYYMSIGVPYDEFWYGDYCSLKYYEANYLRQRKIHNEEFWMQGMYNYHGVAISLANAFRGKGQKAHEYPKEPFTLDHEYEEGLDMSDDKEREIALKRRQFVTNLNNLFRDIDTAIGDKNG